MCDLSMYDLFGIRYVCYAYVVCMYCMCVCRRAMFVIYVRYMVCLWEECIEYRYGIWCVLWVWYTSDA